MKDLVQLEPTTIKLIAISLNWNLKLHAYYNFMIHKTTQYCHIIVSLSYLYMIVVVWLAQFIQAQSNLYLDYAKNNLWYGDTISHYNFYLNSILARDRSNIGQVDSAKDQWARSRIVFICFRKRCHLQTNNQQHIVMFSSTNTKQVGMLVVTCEESSQMRIIQSAQNPMFHSWTTHIEVQHYYIEEEILTL